MTGNEDNKKIDELVNSMKDVYRLQYHSKLFGDFDFKIISYKDFSRIDTLLKETSIDDKEFAQKLLFGQIINPGFPLSSFQKISDDELKTIIRQFSKKNEVLSTYLGDPRDELIYLEFRNAVKKYNDEKFSEFSKTINAAGTGFVNNVISELVSKNFISKIIIPQIDFYQYWLQANPKIFDNLISPLKIAYASLERRQTTIQKINITLKEYNWFYSFSLPDECYGEILTIVQDGNDVEQKIDLVFIRYFSTNDYENLHEMINEWDRNSIFKPRMEIIRDCVQTLRNGKSGYNPSNVVLPVLIAQIDGILMDFIKKHGFSYDKHKRKWKSPSGQILDLKNAYKSVETEFESVSDFSNDLLLNVLFQQAFHGDDLKNLPSFSRHKILHGESVTYGKLENVIRAFLILDFLSYPD